MPDACPSTRGLSLALSVFELNPFSLFHHSLLISVDYLPVIMGSIHVSYTFAVLTPAVSRAKIWSVKYICKPQMASAAAILRR